MDTQLLGLLLVLVLALLMAVLHLLLQLRRSTDGAPLAVLAEKLARLDPVGQAVHSLQLGLTELQSYTKARHDLERQAADSIRHLEAVIAGTQTRGAAGENVVELLFAKLPAEWQVRNLWVGNKVVEFAVRLPNGLVLPIDSKWPAAKLLEDFASCGDGDEQRRLKARIEAAVLDRAREVVRYIDPSLTMTFAVAAVPDAAYDLSTGVHHEAFRLNVVIVSYSMLLPYLLLVFHTVHKAALAVDMEKLSAHLQHALSMVGALQAEVEGRLSRAIVMLTNSRDDLRVQLSQVGSRLNGLQGSTAGAEGLTGPVEAAVGIDRGPLHVRGGVLAPVEDGGQ